MPLIGGAPPPIAAAAASAQTGATCAVVDRGVATTSESDPDPESDPDCVTCSDPAEGGAVGGGIAIPAAVATSLSSESR